MVDKQCQKIITCWRLTNVQDI